jgi:choline dehydrogenase-like flavoprotein
MQYDYIIVGAGSAGCVLAARLSEDPAVSVCLLEAGGGDDSTLIRTPVGAAVMVPLKINNWGFESVPQAAFNGRRSYQPRGKVLGGSSSTNAMIYARGRASDYDGWANDYGCAGWSWEEVLPYFLKAEHNERFTADPLHGQGGPLNVTDIRDPNPFGATFIEAARQCGYREVADFNTGDQEGVGRYQVTQINGERCSAARAYLHPAMARPNLTILTGALTQRVLFEKSIGTPRAAGVQIERKGKTEVLAARREIVLCAGAIQSPQLLMVSGVGPRNHLIEHRLKLVAELPGVGRNLQDHVDYIINRRCPSRELFGVSPGGGMRLAREIFRYRSERRGMLSSNFAEVGGFIKTLPELAEPDIQLHFVVGMVDNHNRTLHLGHGYSLHACVLRPKSRGRITLQSVDMNDSPLIDPDFFSDLDDLETLTRAFRTMRNILGAPAFAHCRGKELYTENLNMDNEMALREAIRERADTIYHPSGTCRMGVDEMAVVDPQLRVRGVEGLRVADASVMPTLVAGNTNAPTMMIGERAADLMRQAA